MIRLALLAGAGFLVAACGVPLQVDTFGPDFDGRTAVRMRGNVLPTPVGGVGGIELNAERVALPEQPIEYALLVEVRADGLEIRNGRSLRLVIDADTLLVARDSLAEPWPRVDPSVREQARYPVADSVLRRLAAASEARMGVRGAGWWEVRRLSAGNLEALRAFVQLHMPAESPTDSMAADG